MRAKIAIFLLFVFLSYVPVLAQVDTAWVRRYNGATNSSDAAFAMAVDTFGNVYVSGFSRGGSATSFDYATIKYSPAGDTLWVRRYDGLVYGDDFVSALAVDDSGNVYVTGSSWGSGTSYYDYATIKYSAFGDTLWVRRYDGPGNYSGNYEDYAYALAVDDSGNVYVTGSSRDSVTGDDYVTIKYDSNGNVIWLRSYDGPGNSKSFDVATDLTIDKNGNLYVTGFSVGTDFGYDFATLKYSSAGELIWVARYGGTYNGSDRATSIAVDTVGNIYVTGHSWGVGTYDDYATIKYSANGESLWVRRYNGPTNGEDQPSALTVDDEGNVYVTGCSNCFSSASNYTTLKYSPEGDELWVRTYNGPIDSLDVANDIAVDSSGNVYVTGYSWSETSGDFATIKYSPDGETLWVKRYNRSSRSSDGAFALIVDKDENIYVTGISSTNCPDIVTIKYIQFTCLAKAGDVNNDNLILLSDIVTIINYLYKSQPAPNPSCRGDANADGNVLLTDIVYLINFIFKSSSAPQKSRECCL